MGGGARWFAAQFGPWTLCALQLSMLCLRVFCVWRNRQTDKARHTTTVCRLFGCLAVVPLSFLLSCLDCRSTELIHSTDLDCLCFFCVGYELALKTVCIALHGA